jgi:hypothetical protein
VGVPANDIALEKRLDIIDVAGLNGWFMGVDILLPSPPPPSTNLNLSLWCGGTEEVGVAAISCSILLRIGSVLISAVLCIHVPVLMRSSCFFLHKMHTHIICKEEKQNK